MYCRSSERSAGVKRVQEETGMLMALLFYSKPAAIIHQKLQWAFTFPVFLLLHVLVFKVLICVMKSIINGHYVLWSLYVCVAAWWVNWRCGGVDVSSLSLLALWENGDLFCVYPHLLEIHCCVIAYPQSLIESHLQMKHSKISML